ncbi:hypothetical protein ZWY2020_031974 [Hordeum vulgare]|nr:hypothetical protein ZWY2020_031974 [Hordeum vulgare]
MVGSHISASVQQQHQEKRSPGRWRTTGLPTAPCPSAAARSKSKDGVASVYRTEILSVPGTNKKGILHLPPLAAASTTYAACLCKQAPSPSPASTGCSKPRLAEEQVVE